MNILITSVGRRVSLVRAFQKELKGFFSEAKVYASDVSPLLSAGCQVADEYFEVPALDESSYIEFLLNLCDENGIKLIIPTIDTELLLLASKNHLFEAIGIKVLISSPEFVKKCRDKRIIHKFFKSNGITIAREYEKDNYELPLFIKPIDGSRSVNTFIISTEEDLTAEHFSNEKLMFLEYLDHDIYDEFTCDLYYDRHSNLKCVVPRKRIEVREGEVYKAVAKNNALVGYIKERLNYIEGATGCITAQFFLHKEDDDKIYGIEINPRFGGGYPLSYLAGANFPKWIIEEYLLGKTIEDKFDSWENDLLMIRYDDEVLVHGYKG
ncbi:ATP-grasp domain-containing protein [Winogradskyella ouciana]|uniref:ATP-grasp domain-containing protein n=1 Tax=Winogradskyella ouciana TaxID=2608631 RepID=A0A7K1GCJ7_9FLAO|nr:ATP-grasp domain-containing protein [Winogradskyella ouciana]MTE25579.1 ATP-grasp domain-containing protein [Winogradskyella ouciana]